MKKFLFSTALLASIIIFSPFACSKSEKADAGGLAVQEAKVAGSFYPASANELKRTVDGFFAGATRTTLDGQLLGLIAPHAGYQYSGPVAAASFKQLEGKKYSRVVVIAPSHRIPLAGAALSMRDTYRTPLGSIPIDREVVRKLIGRYQWARADQRPFDVEHSLEVELPFLQTVLKDFKLVPVIVGAHDKATLDAIADDLDEMFPSNDTLFVASTDLSHYMPYDSAVAADKIAISYITKSDAGSYYKSVERNESQLCGSSPVYILKRIADKRGAEIRLIEYANSGDTAGDKSQVVGYGAFAVVFSNSLGDAQKKELLSLARATVEAHVKGQKLPQLPKNPALKKDGAAFVTLKKHGHLRGCIGQIIAQGPLDKTVQEMAVAAASQDPRFPPVKPDELKDIKIEISVLTPPENLPDPLSVRLGTDGLIIEKGFHRGVLLPQVPTEQGWTKEQYLEGIAQKAGLPKGGWRDAKLSRFQAIVFGE